MERGGVERPAVVLALLARELASTTRAPTGPLPPSRVTTRSARYSVGNQLSEVGLVDLNALVSRKTQVKDGLDEVDQRLGAVAEEASWDLVAGGGHRRSGGGEKEAVAEEVDGAAVEARGPGGRDVELAGDVVEAAALEVEAANEAG